MINLLKAEFYQLKTRLSPKIWLLIALVGGFFMAIVPQLLILLLNNPLENENISVSVSDSENVLEGYTVGAHIELGSTFVIGLAVAVLFVMAYTSFNRALKNRSIINPLIKGSPRYQVLLAKYIGAIALSLAFYLILFISFSGFNLLINGGTIGQYFDGIFVQRLLLALPVWLMWLALYMILLFISASDYTFIVYIIAEIIVNQVVNFLSNHVSLVEEIRPYLFYNLNGLQEVNVNGLNIVPYLALLYAGVFLGLGIYIFKRKEIK